LNQFTLPVVVKSRMYERLPTPPQPGDAQQADQAKCGHQDNHLIQLRRNGGKRNARKARGSAGGYRIRKTAAGSPQPFFR
jgi:hypothetical protein